ncbi:MAG: membrane dipeptidase [Clostridiales bacterium]|nr:membrane dipeptidase [Clostridiales bacterium]
MIPLFDGHCDTLFRLEAENKAVGSLRSGELHIDLEGLAAYAPAAQFFAIWGIERAMPDCDIFSRLYGRFVAELEKNSDMMCLCTTAAEAEKAAAAGKLAAFLGVEGAHLIADGERLEEAYEKGVRMVTITWNNANTLSGTNIEESGRGLSGKGRDFVRRCQRMGVIVDLSHISERGFWDTLDIAEKPVIASHSCSAAVFRHSRNLTDDQFRAVRDIGGTVGLNLFTDFLGGDSVEICLRHIEHFLDLGGEKTLAAGGDLDGCYSLPKPFTGIDGWGIIYHALADRGYPENLLEDIFYNNLMRVVRNICDM